MKKEKKRKKKTSVACEVTTLRKLPTRHWNYFRRAPNKTASHYLDNLITLTHDFRM